MVLWSKAAAVANNRKDDSEWDEDRRTFGDIREMLYSAANHSHSDRQGQRGGNERKKSEWAGRAQDGMRCDQVTADRAGDEYHGTDSNQGAVLGRVKAVVNDATGLEADPNEVGEIANPRNRDTAQRRYGGFGGLDLKRRHGSPNGNGVTTWPRRWNDSTRQRYASAGLVGLVEVLFG